MTNRVATPVSTSLERSPNGNLFPIEIKSGRGLLDASAVVEFGAAVEESIPLLERYNNMRNATEISPAAANQALRPAIKPLMITSLDVTETTTDYATDFHIDVLRPGAGVGVTDSGLLDPGLNLRSKRYDPTRELDEPTQSVIGVGIGEQVVDRLTYWDGIIQRHKIARTSDKEVGRIDAGDWLESKSE